MSDASSSSSRPQTPVRDHTPLSPHSPPLAFRGSIFLNNLNIHHHSDNSVANSGSRALFFTKFSLRFTWYCIAYPFCQYNVSAWRNKIRKHAIASRNEHNFASNTSNINKNANKSSKNIIIRHEGSPRAWPEGSKLREGLQRMRDGNVKYYIFFNFVFYF